jgi:hypothetical protein
MEEKQQTKNNIIRPGINYNNPNIENFHHPLEIPFDASDIIDVGALSLNPCKLFY